MLNIENVELAFLVVLGRRRRVVLYSEKNNSSFIFQFCMRFVFYLFYFMRIKVYLVLLRMVIVILFIVILIVKLFLQ